MSVCFDSSVRRFIEELRQLCEVAGSEVRLQDQMESISGEDIDELEWERRWVNYLERVRKGPDVHRSSTVAALAR